MQIASRAAVDGLRRTAWSFVRRGALGAVLLSAIAATASAQKIPIVPKRRPPPTDPAPAMGPQTCQSGRIRSALYGGLIGFGTVSPVSVFLLVRSPGRNSDVVGAGAVAFAGAATGAIIGWVRSDSRTECRQIVHAPPPTTPNGPQVDTARTQPDLSDAATGPVTPHGSVQPVRRQALDLGGWTLLPAERPATSADDRRREQQ